MTSFAFISLALLLACTLSPSSATFQNDNLKDDRPHEYDEKDPEPKDASPTEQKSSVFPKHLDIGALQNMPLVILHPRTPINFQMLPGENLASLHKSLNPHKILELLQSATFNVPTKPDSPHSTEDKRKERSREFVNHKPSSSIHSPQSVHFRPQFNSLAEGRSLFSHPGNSGWFQRFRGSFSNMFPSIRPFRENQFNFGLPSMNLPVFSPHQHHLPDSVTPFMLGSHQQSQFMPWRNFHHMPTMIHGGDLATAASFPHPTRMLFGNPPMNVYRPHQFNHFPLGDLAASGSAFVPHRVLPHYMPRYASPLQRHKPLFNDVGGLHAASMEISNAFADFTDSKEHGPEVTQKFGAVGHSINSFLKMMGLGATDSFSMQDVGGFGGGSGMAAMDSTPIARSMDFYPGYGNQAHLDDMEDFPIFHEDITDEFMKKANLTSDKLEGTKGSDKEMAKKENSSPVKQKLAATEKDKTLKGSKDSKAANSKAPSTEKDMVYFTAEKENGDHKPTERPTADYKVPPTYATVAPRDRRRPVAIYQHFSFANNKDAPKPAEYAPAHTMPQQEAEENPNKLIDEDEVRQWRSVHSGRGYVEKRPVPTVDILNAPMPPESLKVLQKVLSGGAQGSTQ